MKPVYLSTGLGNKHKRNYSRDSFSNVDFLMEYKFAYFQFDIT